MFKWLDSALDYGILEKDFWEMTIAELIRALNSKKRVREMEAKEKASYDYILANLIGRSVSRIYSSQNRMPDISEVYPSLFDSAEIQEQKQEQKDKVSVARFKAFADSFNQRFKAKEGGDAEK